MECTMNLGFAAGFNIAAKQAVALTSDYILAINNDASIDPISIVELLKAARSSPDLAMLGPTLMDLDGNLESGRGVAQPLLGKTRDARPDENPDYLTWACVLLRKQVLHDVGFLDERFFMYWEDVDFGLRVRGAGLNFETTPAARAVHERSANRRKNPDAIKMYHTWALVCMIGKHRGAWLIGGTAWLAASLLSHVLSARRSTAGAMIKGIWLGVRGRSMPAFEVLATSKNVTDRREPQASARPPLGEPGHARYYRVARSAHLERLTDMSPGDFLYRRVMYDFDRSLLSENPQVRQVTLPQVLWLVWSGRYSVVETVEPYAVSALLDNLALTVVVRFSRIRTDRPTRLVCYAIENGDIARMVARDLSLPDWVIRRSLRLTVGWVYRCHSRIVFGTSAARDNYQALLKSERQGASRGPITKTILGLPRRAARQPTVPRVGQPLIFLGALESRKGISDVLHAWPLVKERVPEARLAILGKGRLAPHVRTALTSDDSISFAEDPPRDYIRLTLSSASALILLSQPAKRWREQIGLPILEGLSSGLEIISSDESGISPWLREHGHRVAAIGATPDSIAELIIQALVSKRSREDILDDLPRVDGRIEADRFLHG